nr:chemosensory protein [Semanotus bifasciatus]
MKSAIVLFVVALCGIALARPDGYTTKYDNVDLQEIIKNDRLLRNYVDCLLGKKKCTNDGEELKKVLPEAIKEDCAKCNETQKNGARTILVYLLKSKRDWFNELEAIYDPEGSYRQKYVEKYGDELKKEDITV